MGELGAGFLGSLALAWAICSLIFWWAKKDGSDDKGASVMAVSCTSILLFVVRMGATRSILGSIVFGVIPCLIWFANKRRKIINGQQAD